MISSRTRAPLIRASVVGAHKLLLWLTREGLPVLPLPLPIQSQLKSHAICLSSGNKELKKFSLRSPGHRKGVGKLAWEIIKILITQLYGGNL